MILHISKLHDSGFYSYDGSVAIMNEQENRVAVIDAVTPPKRGRGCTHKDPARDALANLICVATNNHADLLALAHAVAAHFDGTDAPLGVQAREAIKKAGGA